MKKLLFGSSLLLLSSLGHAQPPRRSAEQLRWDRDSSILAFHLQLAGAKLQKLAPAFAAFYKNTDALVAEERPRPPRFVDMQKLVKQRDALVLRELGKDEGDDFLRIEYLLMPPPPPPAR